MQPKLMSFSSFITAFKEEQGTYFIFALNYIPSNILGLSYFTGTIMYSLIGFIGMTYFYILALETIPNNPKFRGYNLFPLLFFFPNFHFWSCAVGKDTLLFFCIGLFVYGLLNINKRFLFIILALTLSYFIRPHITLFMIIAFGFSFLMNTNKSLFIRIIFFAAMIVLAIFIFPLVLKFTRIEEASVESFNNFALNKASLLSTASSSSAVDIASYPFPLKVFTFLFRPFFFDINSIPSLLACIENSILLILVINILINKPLESFKKAPFTIRGLIYFLIIGTLAFSQSLGNLGIMIRMRNMFLPGLIIFIYWHFSYINREEVENTLS
ncbi:hypothetical protein B0A61_06495 [Flavobacterium aquatile LMG 4008 = ATCC 11947]|uniref:Glycosyltransferase RgtA/B/C/D-like domain-containing protein n=2 Tax=Flavobacterium aquatile TaxID=245 RepID=A0A095SST5_9FLAO|nr:hypothetical protein LG45_10755 [Flavobacterium aquatile LMG 4008 = ATCC 11947]OXA67466.1 hypothetical protein B0A61_06495 [Flavobacterium aquatile LMG 4008 = ATCC 11947]